MEMTEKELKESYRSLLDCKSALEEMVKATDRVERLHSGLQAAVQAGRPTNMIGKNALRYFEGLSESIRVQPTPKVRAMLRQLEARMAADLQMVMEFADRELTDKVDPVVVDEVNNLINDFRRTSWTAVSLRILLSERGEITTPTALPVEQERLRKKVGEIAEREQQCRGKVVEDIEKVRNEAETLLKSPHLPAGMREMLQQTVRQMEQNRQHVQSGKSLEKLPHPMEVVEIGEEPEVEIQAVEPPPGEEGKGPGFINSLDNWLNTPWNVGWDEAKKRSDKE